MKRLLFVTLIFLFVLPAFAGQFVRKIHDLGSDVDLRSSSSWTTLGKTDRKSIKNLIGVLKRSPTARYILSKAKVKAREQGNLLTAVIYPGEVSICDTTLVRRFAPSDPSKIVYENKSKIYLNQELSILDGALDLIHELTHFSYKVPFNPYLAEFKLKKFISNTIEAKGGEVDAYMVECKVLEELMPGHSAKHSTCSKIRDPKSGKISRYQAIREFYKVGREYRKFWNKGEAYGIDKGEITQLSDDYPSLISSAYGLPYPMASILEYETIMKKACNNDLKRLALFKGKFGRFPASSDQKIRKAYSSVEKSYYKRCLNFN